MSPFGFEQTGILITPLPPPSAVYKDSDQHSMSGCCANLAKESNNNNKSKKAQGKSEERATVGAFQPDWLWDGGNGATKIRADSTLDEQSDIKLENHEPWIPIICSPCDFEPKHFFHVLDNLLRNPNITSSNLFRADILYDSDQDKQAWDDPGNASATSSLVKWMKKELQPRKIVQLPSGFRLKRTVVRKLISRKPWLDPELPQTVHVLENIKEKAQDSVVIYIPHADTPENIPFYHPKVKALAISHSYSSSSAPSGSLLVSYQIFPQSTLEMLDSNGTDGAKGDLPGTIHKSQFSNRLQRTAHNFLQIIHKHGTGQKAGYTKRVHHDQIIPQQILQDTYTALKAKYARSLLDQWAEVTDPLKHVFEDLGIAAFLIEVWRTMYDLPPRDSKGPMGGGKSWKGGGGEKSTFPGFVDIGCGNGVLVYLLLSEGFQGWGFDARRRKSWEVFPEEVQEHLQERVLIPKFYQQQPGYDLVPQNLRAAIHDGIFEEGTFIISNHADQLTPWTPLAACSSNCPFIAIPCCSHGLSGKLQRFYDLPPGQISTTTEQGTESREFVSSEEAKALTDDRPGPQTNKPERGSLAPRKQTGPSAYAGLSAHVMHMALSLGFTVQQEILRIPSTRNLCVLGRLPEIASTTGDIDARQAKVEQLIRQEVRGDVQKAADEWIKEALGLTKAKLSKAGAHGMPCKTEMSIEEKRKTKLKELGLEGMDELDLIE
jgi:tRNASer (uridine44-2'-O)-methyltransferase